MAGNTFGRTFTVTTFGESHGPSIGAIVDGCPPGLPLNESDLQGDLDRRRPGQSKYTTQRDEADEVRILSGVFEGVTTGTPIGMVIDNTDQRSRDYSKIQDVFRPAHADLHLPEKVRHSRLSRRRPLVGTRDGDAGGGRRHREKIPGAAVWRIGARLPRTDRYHPTANDRLERSRPQSILLALTRRRFQRSPSSSSGCARMAIRSAHA
jgi:hypothetical protein